jgi:hypothetical protein
LRKLDILGFERAKKPIHVLSGKGRLEAGPLSIYLRSSMNGRPLSFDDFRLLQPINQ